MVQESVNPGDQQGLDSSNVLAFLSQGIQDFPKSDSHDADLVISVAQETIRALDVCADCPDAASRRFFLAVQQLARCQTAAIYAFDGEADLVRSVLFDSNQPIPRAPGDSWPLLGSNLERRIKVGGPYIQEVSPLAETLLGANKYLTAGLRSVLFAPVIYQGRPIGAVILRSLDQDNFNADDLSRISLLSASIGPSLTSTLRYLDSLREQQFAEALNRISRGLNATLDPTQVLQSICRECGELLRTSSVNFYELEEATLVRRVAWVADPSPGVITALPMSSAPESGLAHRVSLTGQAEIVNDPAELKEGELDAELAELPDISSVLAVPLLQGRQVIGVLLLAHAGTERRFTTESRTMAETFADHAAVALQNARLHEATESYAAQIALVDEMADIITTTLDIDEVYQQFAEEVRRLVDFDRMYVILVEDDPPEMLFKYVYPSGAARVRAGDRMQVEGTQTEWVVSTTRTLIREDISASPGFRNDEENAKEGLLSSISVPLISHGRVLGAFTLRNKGIGAYSNRERVILERIASQIAPAIENAELYQESVAEQKRANDALERLQESQQALQESEAKYRNLFEDSRDAIYIRGRDGWFIDVNQAAVDLFWYPRSDLMAMNIVDLCADEDSQREFEAEMEKTGAVRDLATRFRRRDGATIECLLSATVKKDEQGNVIGYQGIIHDVTERNQLEAQFLQSQKMESLGRLAGGIAHDFNNLLAGILGFVSLLRGKLEPGSDNYELAQIIENATQRGAQLTQQLLTAARKSPIEVRPMDVTDATQEVIQILSHTLPKDITIVSRFQSDLPLIQGDSSQIQQVLMNLCINAADAMQEGGTLTLYNERVFLDDEFCRQQLSLESGPYVRVRVSDTGEGIRDEDFPHIFEPFFTTKAAGKGTGLGLSVVYGIIKNHRGAVQVSTELGKGSVFDVYLPVFGVAEEG